MMIKRTNGMTLPFSVSSPNDSSDVARQVGVIYLLSLSALLRSSNRYTVGDRCVDVQHAEWNPVCIGSAVDLKRGLHQLGQSKRHDLLVLWSCKQICGSGFFGVLPGMVLHSSI
jgi:hypothetical protein